MLILDLGVMVVTLDLFGVMLDILSLHRATPSAYDWGEQWSTHEEW